MIVYLCVVINLKYASKKSLNKIVLIIYEYSAAKTPPPTAEWLTRELSESLRNET